MSHLRQYATPIIIGHDRTFTGAIEHKHKYTHTLPSNKANMQKTYNHLHLYDAVYFQLCARNERLMCVRVRRSQRLNTNPICLCLDHAGPGYYYLLTPARANAHIAHTQNGAKCEQIFYPHIYRYSK